jgi:hypothetical protein
MRKFPNCEVDVIGQIEECNQVGVQLGDCCKLIRGQATKPFDEGVSVINVQSKLQIWKKSELVINLTISSRQIGGSAVVDIACCSAKKQFFTTDQFIYHLFDLFG